MGAGGAAGRSRQPYLLIGVNPLPFLNIDLAKVNVVGFEYFVSKERVLDNDCHSADFTQ